MSVPLLLRIIPFLLLLVACKDNRDFKEIYDREVGLTERIEYFPSGSVRARAFFKEGKKHGEFSQYYENGKLEATVVYIDDVLEGISKAFYPSGKLKGETYFSKGLPVGWSYEYWENGKKKISRHFIEFEGDSKRNQFIVHNNAGVAINDSSHYMTITAGRNDTVNLGEKLTFYFNLKAPFYGSKSQIRVLVGGFNDQYKLVNPAMTDTIVGNGLTAEFTVLTKRKGKHVIRGRLDDYKVEPISAEEAMKRYKIKAENPDEIGSRTETVYIYFTKSYYVK